MRQIVKKKTEVSNSTQKKTKKTVKDKDSRLPKMQKPTRGKRKHPDFGTSKLEQDFAKNFLDKLGVKYIWQFEAKEIKRFFDYYLPSENLICEVNGSYWHGDDRIYESKDLNRVQKRAQKIDKYKKDWALLHGIPILYIWEKDIRERPQWVMELLKSKLHSQKVLIEKKEEKNKRHVNKLDKKDVI